MKKKLTFICILLLAVFALHAAALLLCAVESAQAEVQTGGLLEEVNEKLSKLDPAVNPLLPLHKETGIAEHMTHSRPICPSGFQFYHSGNSPPSL
jgi:hypothetical protein